MSYGARTSEAGATCYRGVVVYENEKGEIVTTARGPYETKRPCNAFINGWLRNNENRKQTMPHDFTGTWWDWDKIAPSASLKVVEVYIEEPSEWRKVPRK